MTDPILCQEKINSSRCLTLREKEVAGLLALGYQRQRIADLLEMSARTAGHHTTRIYRKLGLVGSDPRTAFILLAFKKGWLKVNDAVEADPSDPSCYLNDER